MIAYHEINPDTLESIRTKGLQRAARGEKGDKRAIKQTDALLDANIPAHLRRAGVSRANNNYAYVVTNGKVIDITDGHAIDEQKFITSSSRAVLQLHLDSDLCYVSDLDAYDQLKEAVENEQTDDIINRHVTTYWKRVIPLLAYERKKIRRPEIIIPYDIPPHAITVVHDAGDET